MTSGTIEAGPMKLCTVIVVKAYQNTERNFKKNLLKTMGKLGPTRNQANDILFERR